MAFAWGPSDVKRTNVDGGIPLVWAALLIGFVAGFGCGALLVLVVSALR